MDYTNEITLRGRIANLKQMPYGYYFQLVQDKATHHILWKMKGDLLLKRNGCPVKVVGELRYDKLTDKEGNERIVPRIHTYDVVSYG
jgi:hypothetical protein